MKLEGSCHCGCVRFTVRADHPVPFNRCYCSICRKTAGAGGFAVNIGALADTLEVQGEEHKRIYHAIVRNPGEDDRVSKGERHFCGSCGSALWLWDERWPELVHPHASAIDSPLPTPPERTHLMTEFAAPWCEPDFQPGDKYFERYPDESLAAWHARTGLASTDD